MHVGIFLSNEISVYSIMVAKNNHNRVERNLFKILTAVESEFHLSTVSEIL